MSIGVLVLLGLTVCLVTRVSAQPGPGMPIEPCELLKAYKEMDTNNDEKVSKEEFNTFFGFDDDELFSLVDVNGDGVLLFDTLKEECE